MHQRKESRVALGCAVLHRVPVHFLDEPPPGVDSIARGQFRDLIHEMAREGVAVSALQLLATLRFHKSLD